MTLKKVACPQCGAESEWSPKNVFRPFCSERCKLMDLSAWASGAYRIPEVLSAPSPEALEASLDHSEH